MMYYIGMNNEDRLTELEMKMVYAEDTIAELNKVIAIQNQDIESLRTYTRELKKKFDELRETSGSGSMGFEKPPHY